MEKCREGWLVTAAEAWPRLTGLATDEKLTTYGQLGEAIGLHHRVVRYALGPIQDYCVRARLPPLTFLVVNAEKGRPGGGSVVAHRDDLPEIHKEVFRFPWSSHPNPFAQFAPGDSFEGLADQLVQNPERSGEVYAKVRVRGLAQRVFRGALLRIYNGRCAMCGLTFDDALEAAHIIRWADATHAQRMDTRNGILLCATHHKLFDAAFITVTEKFSIRYCDPGKKDLAPYSEADLHVSVDLHGKRLKLPADERHWPRRKWLRQRNVDDEWED